MPLLTGGSLAEQVREGPLPPREAAIIVRQVAEAVQHAHEHGIIHRDLKPANILLAGSPRGSDGQVSSGGSGEVTGASGNSSQGGAVAARVTDFGLARMRESGLSVTGEALGTPSYMPPEQARGQIKEMGPGSDVYGLGAVLYCLLTGRPPFQSSDPVETMRQVCEDEPVPPCRLNRSVPYDLQTICLKCLEKQIGDRFAHAAEVADDLQRFLDGEVIHARPPSLTTLFGQWLRHHKLAICFYVTIAFLLVVNLIYLWKVTHAINVYGEGLTHQQLVSNCQSARLVAKATEQELDKRIHWLELAAQGRLYEATVSEDRVTLDQILRDILTSKGEPTNLFAEATVANRKGELLAQFRREAVGPKGTPFLRSVDPADHPHKQFSWRDWFSGLGDHAPGTVLPPIKQTRISAPYLSTDRTAPRLLIGVSVPIRDPERPNGKVVGVLEGAVLLTEMNAWLKVAPVDTDGFAVLFDARGHCVLHRAGDYAPTPGRGPRRFLDPEKLERLFEDSQGVLPEHDDPVDGRTYLAGYARMSPRIGWVALVQHDHWHLVEPLERLRDQLTLGLIITVVLVVCLQVAQFLSFPWLLARTHRRGTRTRR
jgi:hypothetical protein